MLFYKLSAELNGLPHCSIEDDDDNKSFMHVLALLSSSFLVIFWTKIEYQKESKIFSTQKASGFKASIRNMEIVKLVFVHLSSNTAPVSLGRMVEKRSKLTLPWWGTGRSYQPQTFLYHCDYQTLHFPSIMLPNGFWKPSKPFIPTKSHGNKLHSSVMHDVEIMLLLSF